MAGQKNLAHRKEARRKSAEERAQARAALTDQQQLDRLKEMFGEGKGAQKERTRLAKRIVAEAKKTSAPKKKK